MQTTTPAGKTVTGTAGETITAGQPVYIKTSDSNYLWKADANGSSPAPTAVGVALDGASRGQPLTYQTTGEINPGATVTVAETYILSANAGGICPVADLATGSQLCIIGYGKTASVISLDINATGITKP